MAAPLPFAPTSLPPTSSVETVTPELAKFMLAANTSNRNVRDRVVTTYSRDMQAGRWHFTGEAIKFADDGTLLDGQHRLAAIVKAQVPVQMLVIRGIAHQAQASMDTGAKRTPGDAANLRGHKNGKLLSSVAKMIVTDGARLANVTPSTAELLDIIENDTTLRWVVNSAIAGELTTLRRITSATVIGYAYWRLHAVDGFACAEFFHRLATLEELPAGSPILALHRRLSANEGLNSRMAQRQVLAYIVMAWNAWRKGESRSIVKLAYSQGQLSVPDPV